MRTVKLQYTDLGGNNNKFWDSTLHPDGREVRTWGRVGATGQSKEFTGVSVQMWESQIAEKKRNGYSEVVTVAVANTQPVTRVRLAGLVGDFVTWAGVQAATRISQYLQGDVNNLAPEQIDAGRVALAYLMNLNSRTDAGFISGLQRYYRAIPTVLPSRIDPYTLAKEFDFNEQADRLNQLEAAVQAIQPATKLNLPYTLTEADSDRTNKIMDCVRRTGGQYAKVRAVFNVEAPDATRYEKNAIGNELTLFHGTKQHAVQHILPQGLRCAASPAHLMFGAGIYFSDAWEKSHNYTQGDGSQVIFVCRVKAGNQYLAQDEIKGIKKAPNGYDSVFGKKGYTRSWGGSNKLMNSEIVVYDPSQSRLAAIVWYR